MKHKQKRTTRTPLGLAKGSPFRLAPACFFAAGVIAHGQSVLITPPTIPKEETQAAEQTTDTNQVENAGGEMAPASPGTPHNTNPFKWGPVTFHPNLTYGITYGTGLQSQPGQAHNSIVQTISPGIGCDLGNHWRLSYTATENIYSDSSFRNSLDHNISLAGHTSYEDWTFNLGQTVALTSDPMVATAQQTDQQSYSTTFGASYQINGEYSLSLSAQQDLLFASGYADAVGSTRDWSTMNWLNHQWGPTLSSGIGIGFGYSSLPAPSPDMSYEDMEARISWHFAHRLTLSLNGGAQIRQFIGSGQSSLISPLFGATLSYQPLPYTSIFANVNRTITPSYFQDLVTVNTTVSAGISQRFLGRYFLSLNGGYTVTSYDNSTTSQQALAGRNDTQEFVSAGLTTSFLKHGTASISYSASKNSSNSSGYGYNSNQVGFTLSYGY